MSEITLHTGPAGDTTIIHVSWFDHNNLPMETDIEIAMQQQDKPRTLEVLVNGVVVATIRAR